MQSEASALWRWPHWAALGVLMAASAPFALYAALFGGAGLIWDLSAESRLFASAATISNGVIALHMIGGAIISFLALIQPIAPLRRAWPRLHRLGGYAFVTSAVLSAVCGLIYIGLRGTVGGPLMSVAFAGYGFLTLLAALQTVRFARSGDRERHFEWALRAIVLALGSWIYRVHYTVWRLATGGIASEPDFSGLFDQITLFAFYVPYLVVVELYLARRRSRRGGVERYS